MLIWQLWQALRQPPRHHSLFQWVLRQNAGELPLDALMYGWMSVTLWRRKLPIRWLWRRWRRLANSELMYLPVFA